LTQCNIGSLCSLYDETTLSVWLEKTFGYSKQRLKKFSLNKKYLQKAIRRGDLLTLPLNVLNHLAINPCYQGMKASVISCDENFLILHKPSQCHSHPLDYEDQNNILSYLRHEGLGTEFIYQKMSSYDRSLVYRLDYETSGLMVLSIKNREQVNVQTKSYLAVVSGQVKAPQVLTNNLTTSGKKVTEDKQGKAAECAVFPITYDDKSDQTVVTVFLKQGLRHQIRVQLALSGFPIVGDTLYGGLSSDFFGLHCYAYQIDGHLFKDDELCFPESLLELLDLDSYFEVFAYQFRVSES
jgi:23S rRNA pseudouridine1911/1915/1917 synthase